jgi:cell division septation protein DedD
MLGVEVKERLTGAIILVALIVLLVPALLTGPIRPAPRTMAPGSSAEEAPLRSYTINLAEDAHSRTVAHASGPQQPAPLPAAPAANNPDTPATIPQSAPQDPTPPPATASSPTGGAPAMRSQSPESTAPGSATPASASMGVYVVQLGSFASRANAERLARQVRGQGFEVMVSQGSSGRHLYRVRVGPAHDRGAATLLEQRLRSAGHSGSIVPQ